MADRYVKLSAASKTSGGLTSSDPLGGVDGWESAVASVSAGDTIYLMQPDGGGDINLTRRLVFSNKNGASGSVITVKPYSTNTIILSGGSNRNVPAIKSYGFAWEALVEINASYVSFEDITIKNSGGYGLRVNPNKTTQFTGTTIKDVTILSCRNGGLEVNYTTNATVDGVVIERCENGSDKGPYTYGDHTAAMSTNRCPGITIQNCTIDNNAGEGIIVDGNPYSTNTSYNIDINNCTFYDNAEGNVYIHGVGHTAATTYNFFNNNVVYCTPQSYFYTQGWFSQWRIRNLILATVESWQFPDSNCIDWAVYNNLIANGGYGIQLLRNYKSDAEQSYGVHSDIKIEQNTVLYNNVNLAIQWRPLYNPSGNTLKNNVFIAGTGQAQTSGYFTNALTADYNCWHEEGTGTGPATAVQGGNDLNENPDLVNHTATLTSGTLDPANYVPDNSASSPLIDAGTDTSWTTDFFGNTRTSTNFDIGFAEGGGGEGAVDDITPKWATSLTETGTWPDQYITTNVDTTVTFSDDSTITGSAAIDDRLWIFQGAATVSNAITAPDGTPTATRDASPTVSWSTPSSYDVTYTVYDATYPTLATGKTVKIEDYVRVQSATGGTAGIAYDVVQFDSGDTTINHSLGVTPQAALFVFGGVITLDTDVDDIDFGFSVCDTSPINCFNSTNMAGDGGTSVGLRRTGTSAVKRYTPGDSVYVTGTLTAVSSSALTMSWSGTTTNAEKGYVILIGGASVTAATAVQLTDLNSNGSTQDVSGSWNAAICLSNLSTGAWYPMSNIGFSVKGGNQVCAGWTDLSTTTGDPRIMVRNDAIAALPYYSSYVTLAYYDSYARFTLNGGILSSNPSADACHVLLMNIGTVGAACGVADSPTSTGNNDYSLSFDPGLLLCGLTNATSVGSQISSDEAGMIAFYGDDGTTKFVYGQTSEDASTGLNVSTYASADWKQLGDDQTTLSDVTGAATGVTLGTSKFTVNLDPAGGGKFVYMAFEDAGTGIGTTADFTWTWPTKSVRSYPVVGEEVTFIGLGTAASGQTLTAHVYDWDDGTADGSTENATHTFTESGIYYVTYTVTDSAAGSDSITYPVTIKPEDPYDIYPGVTLDPSSGKGEAPADFEVDWSGMTFSGLTIDTSQSYVTIWHYTNPETPSSSDDEVNNIPFIEYVGYGTAPTITVPEVGSYNIGIVVFGTDDTGDTLVYHYNEPNGVAPIPELLDKISVYKNVVVNLDTGSDDLRHAFVGPKSITFTVTVYGSDTWSSIDWDYDDGGTDNGDTTGTKTHEFAAVTTQTVRNVSADITFTSGLTKTVYANVIMTPAVTDPRNEAETLALMTLLDEVSGCIDTADWSKTGGQTNVYECTLERPWAAATARVTEDGSLLTSQANVAAVDAAAGSYYVTYSSPDITIYVHTTGSDNPATNGSSYRFIRPA